LKVITFESLGTVSYSLSIVTMAVSVAVCEIFSVTMAISCIVCEIYDLLVENCEIFIPHLYLAPPQGVTPSEFREDV